MGVEPIGGFARFAERVAVHFWPYKRKVAGKSTQGKLRGNSRKVRACSRKFTSDLWGRKSTQGK